MDHSPEEEEDPIYERSNIKNPNLPDDLSRSSSPSDEPPSGLEPFQIPQLDTQSISPATEETLADLRTRNLDLSKALEEALQERNSLRVKLSEVEVFAEEREETDLKKSLHLTNELVVTGARVSELLEERSRRTEGFYEILDSLRSVKQCLRRICERVDDGKLEECVEEEGVLNEGLEVLLLEAKCVHMLGVNAEAKIIKYEEMRKKEKEELENSIASLTEENRDIGSLLRIALVEKEAVEKSLSRLKGSGDQKRVAILQIAERGLQKVGFGFMMGASTWEPLPDNTSTSNSSMKSDGSECEEESISLASTVGKIMKSLRLEITELRRSLAESRSDCEQLQILADKQTQMITESTLNIKDLVEREDMLAQNIEELIMQIKDTEEEVARWREACELEVEAGTAAIEEREREAASLREELARTKTDLDALNNKLGLKEKLASDAMAAQAAAETSLRLADSRSIGLRDRIEELMRQLEEEAERNRREHRHASRRRVRHICWPWPALRINPSNSTSSGPSRSVSRRMLPQMEALLH